MRQRSDSFVCLFGKHVEPLIGLLMVFKRKQATYKLYSLSQVIILLLLIVFVLIAKKTLFYLSIYSLSKVLISSHNKVNIGIKAFKMKLAFYLNTFPLTKGVSTTKIN